MASKFYFFTDPAALGPQTGGQTFGPTAASGSKDRFRVCDLHKVKSGGAANAYAVCKGRACIQEQAGPSGTATLNLILQPLVQPPFEFPYVEYYIYRNIDPGSLLQGGQLNLGKEGSGAHTNDLIKYIREKVLKETNPPATPLVDAHYIGLDRVELTGNFGDLQPIDHLFRYTGGAELPIVQAGWKLGTFASSEGAGIEVVVQTFGSQPSLEWARSASGGVVEADKLASASPTYAERLQREAIGCFVDPCAFWGMFFTSGLWFRDPADDHKRFKKKLLCDKLFTAGGIFKNHGRVYLNIRNETGYSYNFYGNYNDGSGQNLYVGSDETTLALKSFGDDKWPIQYSDGLTGQTLAFKLCRTGNDKPLLFVHRGGSASDDGRFIKSNRLIDGNNPEWTKPVTLRRPTDGGVHPPWCFVLHYLRTYDGTQTGPPPTGVFDTSELQVGPVGDRLVAAFRQMWPVTAPTSPSAAATDAKYKYQYVSDKVLRYDGATKEDPADTAAPKRSMTYDRMGETTYVLTKGVGTTTAGEDAVVGVHTPMFSHRRSTSGSFGAAPTSRPSSSILGMIYNDTNFVPSTQKVSLSGGTDVDVLTLQGLNTNVPLKNQLFDLTFLCMGKDEIKPAIDTAETTTSPNFATYHNPLFVTLRPPSAGAGQPANTSAFDVSALEWSLETNIAPAYSVDGIFFSTANYNGGSLVDRKKTYTETGEEKLLSASSKWDGFIEKDKLGSQVNAQMKALVDDFTAAVTAVPSMATGTVNPETALAQLVEQYAKAIWDRAVLLAADPAFEEHADTALYCARAKMEVALKSHLYVLNDAPLAKTLIARFEALSRNYAGLDFSTVTANEKAVLITGFDPYWGSAKPGTPKVVTSNPSGRLALYLAQKTDHEYTGPYSPSYTGPPPPPLKFFARTCIFPVRWVDFENNIVEDTIDEAKKSFSTSVSFSAICTCSLNPYIAQWINLPKNSANIENVIHARLDRFAGRCRAGYDNDNKDAYDNTKLPGGLDWLDNTRPPSDKRTYYETQFKLSDPSDEVDAYDGLDIKLRYDQSYEFEDTSGGTRKSHAGWEAIGSDSWTKVELKKEAEFVNSPTGGSNTNPLTNAVPPGLSPLVKEANSGSGGSYLSNEIFYRVSNLVQSSGSSYSGVKNGHVHVAELSTTVPLKGVYGTKAVTAHHLAQSVLAILDGTLK